jgi:hypothetical protein
VSQDSLRLDNRGLYDDDEDSGTFGCLPSSSPSGVPTQAERYENKKKELENLTYDKLGCFEKVGHLDQPGPAHKTSNKN